MSDLPYLQSYIEPKHQKAYERYLRGDSQRKIAAALKIPPRTIAHWSKTDGWEAERKARAVAASEAPNVAAVAAAVESTGGKPAADVKLSRTAGMEKVLERQQRIAGMLVGAYELDVEKTLSDAEASSKPLSRSQIAQLTVLGNNILAMERKAWCVPDKIETKDTTPQPVDPIRTLTDEQLDRRERELEQQLAAAEGRTAPDRAGEVAPGSVN